MARSNDLIHGGGVRLPVLSLTLQELRTFRAELVVTPPLLTFPLHPASFDQTLFFEPTKNRIKRSNSKRQAPVGPDFDQLADFITMPGLLLEQCQDQKL